MRIVISFILAAFLGSAVEVHAQQAPMETAVSFFWVLIGVSALLVAVGALLVFIKLAQYLERLTERLRE